PGELLSGKIEGEFYERMWNMARADSFDAAARAPPPPPPQGNVTL
ncbi:hypothetical protein ACRCQH_12500, partial [Pseudomonas aeruginosa]